MWKYLPFALLSPIFLKAQTSDQLAFTYDASGNQIERKYVLAVAAGTRMMKIANMAEQYTDLINLTPNPTTAIVNLQWQVEVNEKITKVEVYSLDGLVKNFGGKQIKNEMIVNIFANPSGIYFVKFYFVDGSVLSKKVIKL